MSGSAGQVVFVFLLHVDCSGAAGVGGGGDGVSPGESDGGVRCESHPEVCEGGERAMISSRGEDTPPDTVVFPPSLQDGSDLADSLQGTSLYLEGDPAGGGSHEDDIFLVFRYIRSVVTNITVTVLQVQYAVISVYWRFPQTQHPGSSCTTGQSHLTSLSDQMSQLDSVGPDDRGSLLPLPGPHSPFTQPELEEEQEGERGSRADHHQGGSSWYCGLN